jgi:hypothetical protein
MTFSLTPGTYQILGGVGGQQILFFAVQPNTAVPTPPRTYAVIYPPLGATPGLVLGTFTVS